MGDPCCEKPKLDGFSLKKCDEDLFKMEVAAGRGRGEGGQFGDWK